MFYVGVSRVKLTKALNAGQTIPKALYSSCTRVLAYEPHQYETFWERLVYLFRGKRD